MIRYAFLWSNEDRDGQTAAQTDRPAVLVISRKPADESCIVALVLAPMQTRIKGRRLAMSPRP
ncbi:hypothetical protein [Methylobacterium sp. 37f]|uniref:hypothetical protein n=1 Tax=Methylobacterium sp. 37f TaxID=2817058 RepID=UPI001FFC915B|nr:hypothetical protein [Methylobacterium sp. 37f]MCK2055547.1 hypothetical protein [Methylobacterium sp. 37f]